MSTLADGIKKLLDDSNLFTRHEWARYLGVKESTIDDWLSDASLPRPSNLRMIELEIERASDANKAPLEAFNEVKKRPVIEVSPIVPTSFGANVGQTVGEYIRTPAFPGEKLRHLPTIGVNIDPDSILGDAEKCSRADHRDNCMRMANSVAGIITIRIDTRSRQLIACGSESAIKNLETRAKAAGHSFNRNVALFANME